MRERIQSGGWSGGGATSCDQREALRGVRKIGFSDLETGGGAGGVSSEGKRALRYGSVAESTSSGSRLEKSGMG